MLESTEELRVAQIELSAKLTGDLELPLRTQDPVEASVTSSQPTEPAVSTSQAPPEQLFQLSQPLGNRVPGSGPVPEG